MKKPTLTEQLLLICILIVFIVIISLGVILPRTLLPVYEENLYNHLNESLNIIDTLTKRKINSEIAYIYIDSDNNTFVSSNIEDVIKQRSITNKAILLTGPRQVGKSTLFKHLFSNVNYVTFDDDIFLMQASEDPQMFLYNNPCPLIIDEVQKCPSIFNRIKIILDKQDLKENINYEI